MNLLASQYLARSSDHLFNRDFLSALKIHIFSTRHIEHCCDPIFVGFCAFDNGPLYIELLVIFLEVPNVR